MIAQTSFRATPRISSVTLSRLHCADGGSIV
jgi:hypothetical protein